MASDDEGGARTLAGGRFACAARMGAGAQGEVWSATDTLTGEPAVVKIVRHPLPAARARLRWEVAALRGLRAPGVVRLLDADEEPERLWLAMARVEGSPFPGPLPPRWDRLAPAVEAALGALAAVHRLGLVHGDLKPANLLVRADGLPVLVDFGLSAEAGGRSDGAGTPRYQAPEQAAGEEVDGRADLYALGRMVLEALDGDPDPQDDVISALQLMCSADPEDRPASAGEALRRLGLDGRARVEAAMARLLPADETWRESTLQLLFHGHQRVLHLPEDGARALWLRTGGDRGRVAEVLAAWVREGLASWEQGRISLARASLDALAGAAWPSGEARADGLDPEDAAWLPWIDLLSPAARPDRLRALWPERAATLEPALSRLASRGALLRDGDTLRVLAWPPGFRARLLPVPRAEAARCAAALLPAGERLSLLVRAGAAPREIAAEAAVVAQRALEQGSPAEAVAALELGRMGLTAADPGISTRLLHLHTRAALSLLSPVELDRALYALERGGAAVEGARGLLRAARRGVDGDGEGALRLLDGIPTLHDEDLEIWRAALQVHAAQRCRPSRLEPTLEALEAWAAGRPGREAALAGWVGLLRYRQERYAEAAALHRRAAEGKTEPSARWSSWLNAADALLELGALAEAGALAERAREEAEVARHARHTLQAETAARAARLRARGAEAVERPDQELVEVAFSLGRPANGAMVALGEAALAFWQGEAALCAALAGRAARGFAQERMSGPALLCRALALARSPEEREAEAVIREAWTCAEPGLALQAAALAIWSLPSEPLRDAARALLRQRSPELRAPPGLRLEVLSLNEILGHLRLGGTGLAL